MKLGERKAFCINGHPRTPENLTNGDKGNCKICRQSYRPVWSRKNKVRLGASQKKWYLKNKQLALDRKRANYPEYNAWRRMKYRTCDKRKEKVRDGALRYHYGITLLEFDRMIAEQNFKCAICLRLFTQERRSRPHVDHCHLTGKIRSILCQVCNTGLGLFREDVFALRSAVNYLEYHKL